jgi:RuvB-like protein 2
MAKETTLRYTLNTISSAQTLATRRKSAVVQVDDLKRSWDYFLDEQRSMQWLKEQQGLLIEELDEEEEHIRDTTRSMDTDPKP